MHPVERPTGFARDTKRTGKELFGTHTYNTGIQICPGSDVSPNKRRSHLVVRKR